MAAKSKSKDKKKDKNRDAPKAKKAKEKDRKQRAKDKQRKEKKARDRKKDKGRKRKYRYTADTSDKYELYQLSVQSPEEDVAFLAEVYQAERGRRALHFREDFCGTGLLSLSWISRGQDYPAEAFDIDPEPIRWGQIHHFKEFGDDAGRAVVHLKDAREPSDRAPDVRCAQNFSYWVFRTRPIMLDYFRRARGDLADDGIFVIDLHGGPECYEEMEEETELDEGFTYVWDQDHYYPITNEAHLSIHFRFPDGSEMRDAFTYDWRIWGLTELKEILDDAGFVQVDCYWEGTDEDGESGNGIFTKEARGEACMSYVAYLVALK